MTAQVVSVKSSGQEPACDTVLSDVRNHIGHITLNRPQGLNAMDLDMVRQLQRQLDDWAADDRVYAVVLRGAARKPSARAVTSARSMTASKTATPNTRLSSPKNMRWTSPSIITANPSWP